MLRVKGVTCILVTRRSRRVTFYKRTNDNDFVEVTQTQCAFIGFHPGFMWLMTTWREEK